MIHPVTCICFALACASGLYVYQSKHRVQVIDREIEKTVRATDALREQTRVLHAEWTLLNDPQRLQVLADQFLSLKTVAPGQFTSMADLDSRLPAVRVPEPPLPPEVPVAEAPVPEPPQAPVADAVPPPPPAKPVAVAAAPPASRVPERKPAPPRPTMPVVHAAAAEFVARPPPPRMVPAAAPVRSAYAPLAGSALGMARATAVPLPQPMPFSDPQWAGSGGGG